MSILHFIERLTSNKVIAIAPQTVQVKSKNKLLTTAQVVSTQSALIRRIKMSYGFDDVTFHAHILPSINALAGYLHLIPASSGSIFPGDAGALRMSLEIGLYSIHSADGRNFSSHGGASGRDELRHRWRLASLLAGMYGELHRVLSRVQVVNDDGKSCPVGLIPITEWLSITKSQYYTVAFRATPIETRALAFHIASQSIPRDVINYLSVGDPPVAAQLFSFLGSTPSENNPLVDIVRRTASAVLDRNMRDTPDIEVVAPNKSEDSLIGLLQSILISPPWLPNTQASKAWYGLDGFFISWPCIAKDIIAVAPHLFESGGDTTQNLLALLQESELITLNEDSPLWQILPPGNTSIIQAIRVSNVFLKMEPFSRRLTQMDVLIAISKRPIIKRRKLRTNYKLPSNKKPIIAINPTPDLFPENPAASSTGQPASTNIASEQSLITKLSVIYPTAVNPYVRDALDTIINSTESGSDHYLVRPHEHGLFISSDAWEKAGVDSPVAIRSLFDASMLHLNSSEPLKRVFSIALHGMTYQGCIIQPKYLSGWEAWKEKHSDEYSE